MAYHKNHGNSTNVEKNITTPLHRTRYQRAPVSGALAGVENMDAKQLRKAIEDEIANSDEGRNLHGLNPKTGLVDPQRITVIERLVKNSKTHDQLEDVWLVFLEGRSDGDGYRIVASLDGTEFGLATQGFPNDEPIVMCGWYGDFMSTFRGR